MRRQVLRAGFVRRLQRGAYGCHALRAKPQEVAYRARQLTHRQRDVLAFGPDAQLRDIEHALAQQYTRAVSVRHAWTRRRAIGHKFHWSSALSYWSTYFTGWNRRICWTICSGDPSRSA